MKIVFLSKRFRLATGEVAVRYLGESAAFFSGRLVKGIAAVPLDAPEDLTIDLLDVEATDTRSGEAINIALFSAGIVSVRTENVESGVCQVQLDRCIPCAVAVVDAQGRPVPGADIEVALAGRTLGINTKEANTCLLMYAPEPGWVAVNRHRETLTRLPASARENQAVTLTLRGALADGV